MFLQIILSLLECFHIIKKQGKILWGFFLCESSSLQSGKKGGIFRGYFFFSECFHAIKLGRVGVVCVV